MDVVQERLLCICRKFCHLLFAVSFLLCAGVAAHAQSSSTGDIRGTVIDPSGAVVPGATVSVMNINTGEEKIFKTNRDGIYDTVSTPTVITPSPSQLQDLKVWCLDPSLWMSEPSH
jgi:carboxypeptidase family protein